MEVAAEGERSRDARNSQRRPSQARWQPYPEHDNLKSEICRASRGALRPIAALVCTQGASCTLQVRSGELFDVMQHAVACASFTSVLTVQQAT